MRSLRIGINALYLIPGRVGGTEIYLRSLLGALASIDHVNQYFVFENRETAGESLVDSPRFQTIQCRVRATFRPGRVLWEQVVFPFLLSKYKIDVLFNPGFTSPVFFGGKSVTVFHDLQHKRHPEFFRTFDLPFWKLLLWLSAVRSRRLIAVSQTTADDLAHFYPSARQKIVVIPHGVDAGFFGLAERRRACDRSTNPYILTVSTLHPHKNIRRLMEAFRIFRSAHPEYRLIVAGLKGFAAEELNAVRRNLGLESFVTFTGWIPREQLYGLFELASAYIAPSEFEGFGMPILEALAAGIPSACSSIDPFSLTVGSTTARFDPNSVREIAAAMESITTDAAYRTEAAVLGPEQARLFDWNHSAAQTLNQFRKVADRV